MWEVFGVIKLGWRTPIMLGPKYGKMGMEGLTH